MKFLNIMAAAALIAPTAAFAQAAPTGQQQPPMSSTPATPGDAPAPNADDATTPSTTAPTDPSAAPAPAEPSDSTMPAPEASDETTPPKR